MGGNDITVEGEWVWPEDNEIFYSKWDSGNVFLSFKSNLLMIQYPFCIYMNILVLIS